MRPRLSSTLVERVHQAESRYFSRFASDSRISERALREIYRESTNRNLLDNLV